VLILKIIFYKLKNIYFKIKIHFKKQQQSSQPGSALKSRKIAMKVTE
jgi:hypothetical protein